MSMEPSRLPWDRADADPAADIARTIRDAPAEYDQQVIAQTSEPTAGQRAAGERIVRAIAWDSDKPAAADAIARALAAAVTAEREKRLALLRKVAIHGNDSWLANGARAEYVALTGQEPSL